MSYVPRVRDAAAIVGLLMLGFLVTSCGDPASGCGEGSSAVAFARSLPDDRLVRLYEDAKDHVETGKPLIRVGPLDGDAPEWLSDLTYRNITLDGTRSRIMLNGCFDEFVIIYIPGVPGMYEDESPALILSWGEGPAAGEEVLWSSDT